ncbi:MAG: hypothetical protein BZ137_00775 [Methanosphaera sp. rholeuAM130]|nr:MAG: hypothetical protein BZ137_00775 [Methanosphaera sp. rholeuAM130]
MNITKIYFQIIILCLLAMIIGESELPNEYTTPRNYAVLKENNPDPTNYNTQDPIIVQKYQIHSKTSAKSFTSNGYNA